MDKIQGIPVDNSSADTPMSSSPGPIWDGGLVRAAPLATLLEEERRNVAERQAQPHIIGIAQHVTKCWSQAKDAKRDVEQRMFENLRSRRGEYSPEKLAQIRAMGGSDLFMNLTSVKCRAAGAWLRDILATTGAAERPWTIRPTPVASLPPDINERIVQAVGQNLTQVMQMGGIVTDEQLLQAMNDVKEEATNAIQEEARKRADRMADKMEDQLVEGGWVQAIEDFIDDITTFPSAILKGPVLRRRKRLMWQPGENGAMEPKVDTEIKLEWERVSPFNIYPSPAAVNINDGYLIEKHQLSREDLNALIGVEGYDDEAIREALRLYGMGGLRDWTNNEDVQADAEGKSTTQIMQNDDMLIDALQFWGPVSGKMLLEWGMSEKEILDETEEYHVEAWLVGQFCIKAVLNYDPLCRRPYYKASYEEIPGCFWGNSVADLITDTQVVVNAAGRAIVNNMGIASGPQVHINVDRLADGEDVTTLSPWRIWQTTSNPAGTNEKPIDFFQPDSRIGELMAVFEKFSQLTDEYSGLPKYMAGDNQGVGRTASGLSMLMSNAGKTIKQVVANIDMGVMTPMLEQLYAYNMQYADDPDLKGDVQIVARGATSIANKETAQVRRNEFLQITANPVDMQIVGIEGRANILREAAKNLDMDVDKVVPPLTKLRARMAMTMAAQQAGPQGSQPALPGPGGPQGQSLEDGTPVTDTQSPPEQ